MSTKKALGARTLFDIALGVAASVTAATSAGAQPAPVYNWTGYYVGVHAGYRWADANFTSSAYNYIHPFFGPAFTTPGDHLARNETYASGGGIFGTHAGYNFMFTPVWLVGIETDISLGNHSSSVSSAYEVLNADEDGFTFRGTSTLTVMWQATIRGRLGVVYGPWLFYGTGGVAFTRAKWSDISDVTVIFNGNSIGTDSAAYNAAKTLTGGVVGAGIEYMFIPNWIGRVEYLYEFFGSFDVPHGFGPQVGNVDLDVHKVRFAVSYKFGP